MDGGQQLCDCRSFLSKTMLVVSQNAVDFKEFHDMAMYNMFQDFAYNASKRSRSTVLAFFFLPFLEYSVDLGLFPFKW